MADQRMFYEEVAEIRDGLIKRPTIVMRPFPPLPPQSEEEHLDEIRDAIYTYLRGKQAPPTCRNIIHAMFEMGYADWLGHDESQPTCPYEMQADGT